jgi:hypothetical protein
MNERNLECVAERRRQCGADFFFREEPVLLLAAQARLIGELA